VTIITCRIGVASVSVIVTSGHHPSTSIAGAACATLARVHTAIPWSMAVSFEALFRST
jgi:hypothetical protein